MRTFYNEIEPYAVQWLRNLIEAGELSRGLVNERSIKDVRATELMGYTRAHFFAGIGGWDLALQLAGWPKDWPVWTGSCPCQPFSQVGKRKGVEDERHLWPVFYRLIEECRPPVVFGEQVASKDGRLWLAGVRSDLEALGYAVGATDLCAASINAPHIRQRLWWVAYADNNNSRECSGSRGRFCKGASQERNNACRGSECGRLDFSDHNGQRRAQAYEAEQGSHGEDNGISLGASGRCCGMGDSLGAGLEGYSRNEHDGHEPRRLRENESGSTPEASSDSPWGEFRWVYCLDNKARRIESGIAPLAHGISGRVELVRPRGLCKTETQKTSRWYNRIGAIKAYGNAIVPQVAAEFIKSAMEAMQDVQNG